MTEQEAEVLAQRLTRIWEPLDVPQWSVDVEDDQFSFFCRVADGVTLLYPVFAKGPLVLLDSEYMYASIEYRHGNVNGVCTAPSCALDDELNGYFQEVDQFAAQWMDFFRRNCWLSGCDIEASAHEKAEWMQGFTREEIEAWNLKI